MDDTFTFEGFSVHTSVTGHGEPMIMVHGTPWSSFNLRHLVATLSDRFRIHAYDMLGYGSSDKPDADVSLAVQNRLLAALLDGWGLEDPIAVGHDIGGATVLRTHLLNHRQFSSLVLIDPVVLSPWGSPFFRHVREHRAAFEGLPGNLHRALVREYIGTAAFQPLEEHVLTETVNPWLGAAGQAGFYRQIAQANELHTLEIVDRLGDIDVPVLILWGEEDTWIPVDRGAELSRRIPGSEFQPVSGAGHLVIEERPGELARRITAFAQRLDRSTPSPQRDG